MAGAARGPRRDHRSARGPLGGVPRGAAARRARRQGAHPWRIPLRHQGFRRRVLRAVEDGGRQHRPAAADGAGADVGGAWSTRASRRRALRGESVGVYIGSSTNDYSFLAMSDPSTAHPYAITGTASSIIANRVSYFYDFRGPSIAVDTACSSSLVAAHQGVQALRSGRGRRGARRRRQRADHPARHDRLRRGRRRAGARRPDQVVLAGRRRLRALRGRRHAGAQARRRRPPRRRRDPRGHRGQRDQPRRPLQRHAGAQPRRAGRGAAQGVQGRRHRPARRRLHRGARHRHHPR